MGAMNNLSIFFYKGIFFIFDNYSNGILGKNLFAAVDLHNNTGRNPHYCAVTCLEENTLRLASMFDGNILYFTDPKEVFSNFFSTLCPSLTIEAGQSGDIEGINKINLLIKNLINLNSFGDLGKLESLFNRKKIFESFGKIKIPNSSSVRFDNKAADFNFESNVEDLNFNLVQEGHIFGYSNSIEKAFLSTTRITIL